MLSGKKGVEEEEKGKLERGKKLEERIERGEQFVFLIS